MASFRLCYNLHKRIPDRDYLGLHLVSWVIAAIGPLVWVNIYDIIPNDNKSLLSSILVKKTSRSQTYDMHFDYTSIFLKSGAQ
jgi:hypothetical protein